MNDYYIGLIVGLTCGIVGFSVGGYVADNTIEGNKEFAFNQLEEHCEKLYDASGLNEEYRVYKCLNGHSVSPIFY